MKDNFKKRILTLLTILRKESNQDHHLKLDKIISKLEEHGVEVSNRKTLYDDFKVLNECGYDVEYDVDGYYLLEAPFSISEIKIIQDSIYSLKNLDDKLLNDLNAKLYTFISYAEEEQLNKLKYSSNHKNRKLLQRMEDVLYAIKDNKGVVVKTKKEKKELIFPVFLHRNNDYYYFYFHYQDSEKLYHYRFDNIVDLTISDIKNTINISRKKIIDTINASSNSYYNGKIQSLNLVLLDNDQYLIQRFLDDFPSAIKTKNGFNIKTNINDNLFSKLTAYKDKIKISDKDIAKQYIDYLKSILNNY